jgi:hypothetical protein
MARDSEEEASEQPREHQNPENGREQPKTAAEGGAAAGAVDGLEIAHVYWNAQLLRTDPVAPRG